MSFRLLWPICFEHLIGHWLQAASIFTLRAVGIYQKQDIGLVRMTLALLTFNLQYIYIGGGGVPFGLSYAPGVVLWAAI